MLLNLIKAAFIGCIFILFSCGTAQKEQTSAGGNLCKHSQLLEIYPKAQGYAIRIHNPEQPEQPFNLSVNNSYGRIALLSATHVGMMAAIQQQAAICAIPDAQFLYDASLRRAVRKGKVADLKSEASISVEKLLAKKTQVLVYSGFGNEQTQIQRLNRIGIQCIPNFEWRETNPLARAEWVLLFGVLTGQIAEAQHYFNRVAANYERIKEQEKLGNQNPLLISGYIYGDQWVAPAGQSFEATFYKDAGFRYYFDRQPGTGSCFSSIAQVLTKSAEVVYWINPAKPSRAALLQEFPKYSHFPFFNKRIFCYTHQTNKYWEQAAAHPDWILSDLRQIIAAKPKNMHFYKELAP
jgi:iron complex transport system substrate-binding protein